MAIHSVFTDEDSDEVTIGEVLELYHEVKALSIEELRPWL
jgi:hypothetical protein